MSMSEVELIDAVRANLGGRTDLEDMIKTGLRLGLEELGHMHNFEGMISTPSDISISASDSSVDLPSNTKHIKRAVFVNSTSSYPIRLKTRRWVESRYPNPSADAEGKPVYGYKQGDYMYFVPYSDGSYSVRLTVYTFPKFAADGTTPIEASRALIDYGTAYCMDGIERFKSSREWYEKFRASAASAIKSDRDEAGIEHGSDSREGIVAGNYWDDPFCMRVE